jgi:hypothetical protein
MPEPFVSFAFSAGELAPGLLSRPDLEKYDLALRSAKNWVVDYRGGIVVRPGLQFISQNKNTVDRVRLVPFQFNLFEGNNYIMVFGDGYIRFLRNGRFITDSTKSFTITSITNADPAVVTTAVAHGFTGGRLMKSII